MHTNTTNETQTVQYDTINYCPYCGAKVQNDFKYCAQCGKPIPRTTTTPMVIFHWNTEDGRVTYPYDGLVRPYTIC